MRLHHTKNKGDLGVMHAQLDLAKRGFMILTPATEHASFDLVAYSPGRFIRVQVKYRAAVHGTILVPLRTSWADGNGIHTVPIDRNAIDLMCAYCPDTDRCYYFEPKIARVQLALRLAPALNNNKKRVHFAADFTEVPATCGVFASQLVSPEPMLHSVAASPTP